MEELLKQLVDGQKILFNELQGLKAGQERLEIGQAKLWENIFVIKEEMGTKAQQQENTAIIKAILHNQEITTAKLDALALNTISKKHLDSLATKEDVAKIDAKCEVLNSRLFAQETQLTLLKAAK